MHLCVCSTVVCVIVRSMVMVCLQRMRFVGPDVRISDSKHRESIFWWLA